MHAGCISAAQMRDQACGWQAGVCRYDANCGLTGDVRRSTREQPRHAGNYLTVTTRTAPVHPQCSIAAPSLVCCNTGPPGEFLHRERTCPHEVQIFLLTDDMPLSFSFNTPVGAVTAGGSASESGTMATSQAIASGPGQVSMPHPLSACCCTLRRMQDVPLHNRSWMLPTCTALGVE